MSLSDWVRGWLAANRLLVLTLVFGSISVVCLFVIPVYVIEPMWQGPEPTGTLETRRRSRAFTYTFFAGVISSHAFVIFLVKLVLPEEWKR